MGSSSTPLTLFYINLVLISVQSLKRQPPGRRMVEPSVSQNLPRADTIFFGVLGIPVLVYLGFWFYENLMLFFSTGSINPSDFNYFWLVSDLLPDKAPHLAYDPEAYTREASTRFGEHKTLTAWPYPPHSWLLLWPLALIPLEPSFIVWEILGVCLLGFAVYITFGGSPSAILFVLASPVVAINLRFGQIGSLTSALLIAGLGLIERRPYLSGLFFGLLTIKPTLGVLIPIALIAGRHWRVFGSAVITTLCLVIGSIMIFGIKPWIIYLTVGISHVLDMQLTKSGTVASHIPTVTEAVQAIGFELDVALTAQLAIAVGCMILVARVWHVSSSLRLCSALLMSCVILVPPYALSYDLPITVVSALILIQEVGRDKGLIGEHSVVLLVWLLPALMAILGSPIAPIVLLLLATALTRRCLQARPQNF